MSNGVQMVKKPSEAMATVSTDQSMWGHITVTCNMSSPGYPAYMICFLDNAGKFHPNLSVTQAQFASAQFAQQNKFNVLLSMTGNGPGAVNDMLVYS